MFNNREISTCVWLIAFSIWVMTSKEVRKSVLQLIKAATNKQLVFAFSLMFLYVCGIIKTLYSFNVWNFSFLKETIYWFFFSALVLIFKYTGSSNRENVIFKTILIENLKIIVFVEFLVNVYVFPLFIELIILPIVVLVNVMLAMTDLEKHNNIQVKRFLEKVNNGFGLLIMANIAIQVFSNLSGLWNMKMLFDFIMPLALTLLFFPFLLSLILYSRYSEIFVRVNMAFKKDPHLIKYTKIKILKECLLSVSRINDLRKNLSPVIWSMRTKEDVDEYFAKL